MRVDVDDPNAAVYVNGNAAWFFDLRLSGAVLPESDKKFAVRVEFLYAAIAAIGDEEVAVSIGRDPLWTRQLSVFRSRSRVKDGRGSCRICRYRSFDRRRVGLLIPVKYETILVYYLAIRTRSF